MGAETAAIVGISALGSALLGKMSAPKTPDVPSANDTMRAEEEAAAAAKQEDRRDRLRRQSLSSLVNRNFGQLGTGAGRTLE